MSNKIPTAEEYFKPFRNEEATYGVREIEHHLRQFAQLHVEAALKAASEKATLSYRLPHDYKGEKAGFKFVATKESILNAYPKENIL